VNVNVSSEWMIIILGAVLSLVFSLTPGLRVWFAKQATEVKQLFMAGVTLVIAIVVFGLGCYSILQTDIACTAQGVFDLLIIYFMAVAANQGVYKVTPLPTDVQKIKLDQANKEEIRLLK
jgi:hypothetical protein